MTSLQKGEKKNKEEKKTFRERREAPLGFLHRLCGVKLLWLIKKQVLGEVYDVHLQ